MNKNNTIIEMLKVHSALVSAEAMQRKLVFDLFKFDQTESKKIAFRFGDCKIEFLPKTAWKVYGTTLIFRKNNKVMELELLISPANNEIVKRYGNYSGVFAVDLETIPVFFIFESCERKGQDHEK